METIGWEFESEFPVGLDARSNGSDDMLMLFRVRNEGTHKEVYNPA
jgi:hypothetical protein